MCASWLTRYRAAACSSIRLGCHDTPIYSTFRQFACRCHRWRNTIITAEKTSVETRHFAVEVSCFNAVSIGLYQLFLLAYACTLAKLKRIGPTESCCSHRRVRFSLNVPPVPTFLIYIGFRGSARFPEWVGLGQAAVGQKKIWVGHRNCQEFVLGA